MISFLAALLEASVIIIYLSRHNVKYILHISFMNCFFPLSDAFFLREWNVTSNVTTRFKGHEAAV